MPDMWNHLDERQSTIIAKGRAVLERGRGFAESGSWQSFAFEFLLFGLKQAWACLFGGLLLFLILVTYKVDPTFGLLYRYDFLFLAAIFLQVGLIASGLETWREARVILIFHIAGTVMELFKTHYGSWTYPGDAIFRIAGVPLFTGFMYAAVGSYIARAWRAFHLEFRPYPPFWQTALLAGAIYVNFFAHHVLPDFRSLLFFLTGALFGRVRVYFTVDHEPRWMPLLLGFGLIAFFIWIAENLSTFATIWQYPDQVEGWQVVSLGKLGSWFLLMIISFVLVTLVHRQGLERRDG